MSNRISIAQLPTPNYVPLDDEEIAEIASWDA